MDATVDQPPARELAMALEAFSAQVYFSPECHDEYANLGFGKSPAEVRGVAMPDGAAYFTSRGSVMGQVPGQLVAAAFGVFNPSVVVPAVTTGWGLIDAATIEAARTRGALGQLRRILGESPADVGKLATSLESASSALPLEGHPLYAGLMAVPVPDDDLGAAWRFADRLREFRGDAHIAAWTSAGFDAVEIGLITELFWGLPMKTYVRSRAWSEEQLDAGIERLTARGLVSDGAFTAEGRAAREAVEEATDRQCQPIIDALGDDFGWVCSALRDYSAAIREAKGYPASGPHDLAKATQGG
ncbi:MAG TPA: hypothetical protein VFH70_12195 [Acidimicrobiales bacterium]|nr:hypothetical protein [Acidimicrobiales bacterium]